MKLVGLLRCGIFFALVTRVDQQESTKKPRSRSLAAIGPIQSPVIFTLFYLINAMHDVADLEIPFVRYMWPEWQAVQVCIRQTTEHRAQRTKSAFLRVPVNR